MEIHLSKQMAQKIVDTVKDVCGHDINFINTEGIIFASTNEERIGEFHEIGKKVVDTREIIEVETDESFYGTQKGVNIPFVYKHEMIAAIGISGVPDEVRQFAVLAQKITNLLLKEQEMDTLNYGYKNQESAVVRSLIENKTMNREFLEEFLKRRKLTIHEEYRMMIIRPDSRYHHSNMAMLENEIYQMLRSIPSAMYSINYLSEYWVMFSEKDFTTWKKRILQWAENNSKIVRVGIGSKESIYRQSVSYQKSKIALKSLDGVQSVACYDELVLEIILGSIPENAICAFQEKTISQLKSEDMELLRMYFQHEMSLKKTADVLFVHKNTIQYQLNRIERLTGYDPRKFTDAVKLYLALQLENDQDKEVASRR